MNHIICACGVVCEGHEGPIVALLDHQVDCRKRHIGITADGLIWLFRRPS